jgi:hypothetical protein
MSRRLSLRVRSLLALAIAFAAFAVAVPASASAGQVDWELRSSWLTYMGIFGGRTTATGTATFSTPLLTSPQVGTGAGNVAAFDGGFNSVMSAHGIDVLIEDLSIDYGSGAVSGSGHYKPVGARAVTTFGSTHLFNLTGGTRTYVTGVKLWESTVPQLTAAGATVFNGGSSGAYAERDPFGRLTAEGDF